MIEITQEMFDAATQEVARRGGYLNPHFNLDYLDEQTRQIIGFLGEFACQEHLGIVTPAVKSVHINLGDFNYAA